MFFIYCKSNDYYCMLIPPTGKILKGLPQLLSGKQTSSWNFAVDYKKSASRSAK